MPRVIRYNSSVEVMRGSVIMKGKDKKSLRERDEIQMAFVEILNKLKAINMFIDKNPASLDIDNRINLENDARDLRNRFVELFSQASASVFSVSETKAHAGVIEEVFNQIKDKIGTTRKFQDEFEDEEVNLIDMDDAEIQSINSEVQSDLGKEKSTQPRQLYSDKKSRLEQDIEDDIKGLEKSQIDKRKLLDDMRNGYFDYKENKIIDTNTQGIMYDQFSLTDVKKVLDVSRGAIRLKKPEELESQISKVRALRGQLKSALANISYKSDVEKAFAFAIKIAIMELKKMESALKNEQKNINEATLNKRPAEQVLEGDTSKKARREPGKLKRLIESARSSSQEGQSSNQSLVTISLNEKKITNAITQVLASVSISMDFIVNATRYNTYKDQIAKATLDNIPEIQKNLDEARNHIIDALGFKNEFQVLENLANNPSVLSSKENAHRLLEGASKMIKVLNSELEKLEKKQKTVERLGQGGSNSKLGKALDAAEDVINISLIKLDQIKAKAVQHLPPAERKAEEERLFKLDIPSKK